jgi:hypothetical protein
VEKGVEKEKGNTFEILTVRTLEKKGGNIMVMCNVRIEKGMSALECIGNVRGQKLS